MEKPNVLLNNLKWMSVICFTFHTNGITFQEFQSVQKFLYQQKWSSISLYANELKLMFYLVQSKIKSL